MNGRGTYTGASLFFNFSDFVHVRRLNSIVLVGYTLRIVLADGALRFERVTVCVCSSRDKLRIIITVIHDEIIINSF